MKKLASLLSAVLAFGLAASSFAADATMSPAASQRRVRFGSTGVECGQSSCKVLTAVALNDSTAAHRTFKLLTPGLSRVTIQVDLTRSSSTDLQLACTGSLNSAASYGTITSTAVTAGTGTVTDYHDVNAGTSTRSELFTYDVMFDALKCILSGSSAGPGDLVTVYAVGSVGQ